MNTIDVATASTKELVEFYNLHSEKPVKKFADRATAEKRVTALVNALAWEDDNVRPVVVHSPRPVKAEEPAPDYDAMTDEEFEAKVKSELVEEKTSERKSNSEGIKASWGNEKVFEARMTRNGVIVKWGDKEEEFKSVRAAFTALNLPDSKHIRFRMKLKEAKVAVFDWVGVAYRFEIV
ncbi:hypothetical protein KYLE_4 [Pantoea phage Kyle]|uniref:Uncharacterized protein n=1 Tax=Pantoea phage Kyle TaxID=2589665 RepID=A0A514A8T9_9CAUD|nr:hypothetical protein HWC52_gp004 [Pantoea phage Kyle]YP_009849942.1 hypothetical protein HWC52_gp110 [Pantoea phage Kyle]QDH49598.1 hypothetical protein KYLE_110 [Pantoea phage Kyle]QDH49669.1 hypothetical protein KYLE_4 [Pantoea phage Kyle]